MSAISATLGFLCSIANCILYIGKLQGDHLGPPPGGSGGEEVEDISQMTSEFQCTAGTTQVDNDDDRTYFVDFWVVNCWGHCNCLGEILILAMVAHSLGIIRLHCSMVENKMTCWIGNGVRMRECLENVAVTQGHCTPAVDTIDCCVFQIDYHCYGHYAYHYQMAPNCRLNIHGSKTGHVVKLYWPFAEVIQLSTWYLFVIVIYEYQSNTVTLHKMQCDWVYRRFQWHSVNWIPLYPYVVTNCGNALDSQSIQSSSGKDTSIVHNSLFCSIYFNW